ncbi:hypothetical protein IMG5_143360, partial [Ichthyophthirius multifiliis]
LTKKYKQPTVPKNNKISKIGTAIAHLATYLLPVIIPHYSSKSLTIQFSKILLNFSQSQTVFYSPQIFQQIPLYMIITKYLCVLVSCLNSKIIFEANFGKSVSQLFYFTPFSLYKIRHSQLVKLSPYQTIYNVESCALSIYHFFPEILLILFSKQAINSQKKGVTVTLLYYLVLKSNKWLTVFINNSKSQQNQGLQAVVFLPLNTSAIIVSITQAAYSILLANSLGILNYLSLDNYSNVLLYNSVTFNQSLSFLFALIQYLVLGHPLSNPLNYLFLKLSIVCIGKTYQPQDNENSSQIQTYLGKNGGSKIDKSFKFQGIFVPQFKGYNPDNYEFTEIKVLFTSVEKIYIKLPSKRSGKNYKSSIYFFLNAYPSQQCYRIPQEDNSSCYQIFESKLSNIGQRAP